ncbi:uncharacterized protein LOC126903377 [Daktulosphaira vitifoliae]|uniref:uncharacterized protein LOC126903377 n=1 Tax=Daktulosphaira vitifoliae TaxID=58002 RepID=UPI0021A9A06A|nr:uncharacterized protein LOC126903377 [Daktulosphaira vitifoliae]
MVGVRIIGVLLYVELGSSLNVYQFWILNQSSMVFCSSSSYSCNNLENIINIFNYIRQQDGWDLKMTYKLRIAENTCLIYQLKNILTEVNKNNFKIKIPLINELIIFRYTESLKVFRYILNSFVKKCYSYEFVDAINFIDCSKKLRTAVQNSNTVIQKLLYAVVFLSNINEYLNNNYKLKLVSIVRQIRAIYCMTYKEPKGYNNVYIANKVIGSVNGLITNTLEKKTLIELDEINNHFLHFNSNSVDATLVVKYSIDPKLKITKDTVDEHVAILGLYNAVTIQDEYELLGFDKLIDSDTKRQIEQQILNYNENIEEGEFIPDSEFGYDED